MASQVQALVAVDQRHPLHAQRVGVGGGQYLAAVPALARDQLGDDVGVVRAEKVGVEQAGRAVAQRLNRAHAGIIEVVERRLGAVVDARAEADELALQADGQRQANILFAHAGAKRRSLYAQLAFRGGNGQIRVLRQGHVLPVFAGVQHSAEERRGARNDVALAGFQVFKRSQARPLVE